LFVCLIEPRVLAGSLKSFTVIDARPLAAYAAGHVPGAWHLSWEDWCAKPPVHCATLEQPGYWGLLADPEEERFASALSNAGIRNDRPVVVYAEGSETNGREGRIAWMLLYLGVREVHLLNGGWQGWLRADGAIAHDTSRVDSSTKFVLNLQHYRRCRIHELEELQNLNQTPQLIDTRTPDEYAGRCFEYQPRKGAISGSILFPFRDLIEPDGTFISQRNYSELLEQRGIVAQSLIAYCEVGVRASTFALIHEIYTGHAVRVFDGSIMEWGARESLPMTPNYCPV
jgi:thiosulfate/3-mercaptopyruvate sulfurtransferase